MKILEIPKQFNPIFDTPTYKGVKKKKASKLADGRLSWHKMDAEIRYIKKNRYSSYTEIAKGLNEKFGHNLSSAAIASKMKQLKIKKRDSRKKLKVVD